MHDTYRFYMTQYKELSTPNTPAWPDKVPELELQMNLLNKLPPQLKLKFKKKKTFAAIRKCEWGDQYACIRIP